MHQSSFYLSDVSEDKLETKMFLTAKLNLISGMVIGAAAVMMMQKMFKNQKKQKGALASEIPSNQQH